MSMPYLAKLIKATLDDYPTIQNMARFYVYDISQYLGDELGWECPENGLYECIDFKKYWEDEHAHPFLIRIDNELAGFVIIDKKGSDERIDFNMAQFFVLRKFQGKGVGKFIATTCFNVFKGKWEVMVLPNNIGAYNFWKQVIQEYTNGHFTEYTKEVSHLDCAVKDIFAFTS